MEKFSYPAILTKQTQESKPLVFFAAPATDIKQWAGIPQRKRFAGHESVGFQREMSPGRVKELADFFQDHRNVVQNPLLAALQDAEAVKFEPESEDGHFGRLVVDPSILAERSLLALMRMLAKRLQERVPGLDEACASEDKVARLTVEASERYNDSPFDEASGEGIEDLDDENPVDVTSSTGDEDLPTDFGAALLAEETGIVDFFLELDARIKVLERTGGVGNRDEFLGFTREVVLSYLLPVVLVDGQHRLQGAVLSVDNYLNDELIRNETAAMVGEPGRDPNEIENIVRREYAPHLPISLLMDDSPSEHVFQFVVVNQKATPLTSALLGTIVSTSLGKDELGPISDRLRKARIPLDDSSVIAYLSRAPESPFAGLVQTGMASDQSGHLKWTVLQGLVRIFRELSGGRPYHGGIDYAASWLKVVLKNSTYGESFDDINELREAWGGPAGPWREVFIKFFSLVRDYFGTSMPEMPNVWGDARTSNLFNKVSLTILSADFFQFLYQRRILVLDGDEVERAFRIWADRVSDKYFAKDWKLEGVKKDSAGIRKKWSQLWHDYREDPGTLPSYTSYQRP